MKSTVLREKGDCKEGRAHIGAKYLLQLYSSPICSKDPELHVQGFQGEGEGGAAYGKIVCNPKTQNLNIEGHPKEKQQN